MCSTFFRWFARARASIATEWSSDTEQRHASECRQPSTPRPTTRVGANHRPAEYVLDANAARRNQSTGARAMSTALVLVQAFQVREETDAAER